MINSDQLKRLIDTVNVHYIRVIDMRDHKIYEYHGANPDDVKNNLEENRDLLSGYGRVKVLGATEAQYKQSWKDCYKWDVMFNAQSAALNKPSNPDPQPKGWGMNVPSDYVHKDVLNLHLQLAAIQSNQDRLNKELEFKMMMYQDEKKDPMKYLPLLGMFLNVDESKIARAMKFAQLSSAIGGGSHAALAGPQQENKLTIQGTMTDEEKVKAAEKEIEEYVPKIEAALQKLNKSVPLPKILETIEALNSRPDPLATVNQLLSFI